MSDSWGPGKIRENARNWSLEGDARILEYMESISQNLDRRSKTTIQNIDKLNLGIDETSIQLGNVTNKLLALQHSQFVENRVNEEEEIVNCETKETAPSANKVTLSPLDEIQFAIDNGLRMLTNCYEKVSLEELYESDNDDEDDDKTIINTVFRAKDTPFDQPLPFKIGSKEWKEKWHVGLLESDVESDEDNKVDEFSDTSSSSASLTASLPSNAPTVSESEGSFWGLNVTGPVANTGRTDIFHNSEDEEVASETHSVASMPAPLPAARTIFPEQRATRQIVNLFDDKPPDIEDFTPQKKKKPIDIFDDDGEDNSDEDRLFISDIRNSQPKPKQYSNIFDNEPPPTYEPSESKNTYKYKTDDKRNNNTIFGEIAKEVKSKVNLFDDDDINDNKTDVFVAKSSQANTSNKENSRTSQAAPFKQRSYLDDECDEDSDDLFAKVNQPKRSVKPIKTAANLFSSTDDEGDDDFEELFKNSKAPKPVTALKIPSLPIETPKVEPISVFAPKAPPPKKKIVNLFDDDDDDDDDEFENLFKKAAAAEISSSKTVESLKKDNDNSANVLTNTKTNESSKLFEGATKEKLSGGAQIKSSLFSDDVDDDDNFEEMFKSKHSSGVQSKNVAISSNSLFHPSDEKEDEFESLFQPLPDIVKVLMVADDSEKLFKTNPELETKPEVIKHDIILCKESNIPVDPDGHHDIPADKSLDEKSDDEWNVEDSPTSNHPHTNEQPIDNSKIFDYENEDDDSIFDTKPKTLFESNDNISKVVTEIKSPDEEQFSVESNQPEPNETTEDHDFIVESDKNVEEPPDLSHIDFINDCNEKIDENDDEDDWLVESNVNIFDKFNEVSKPPTDLNTSGNSSFKYNQAAPIFDELPPPDDDIDIVIPPVKTRTHVYFDDFDTFQPSSADIPPPPSTKSSVIYLLSDEPPVDDFGDEVDKITKSESINDKINIFAHIEEREASPTKQAPIPKKLNTNLNINVGALLPGAKRPSIIKATEQEHTLEYEDVKEETNDQAPVQQSESDSTILKSLNKNRAKIQSKRRPQTRKARQNNYRNSVIVSDDESNSIETLSDEKNKPIESLITSVDTVVSPQPVNIPTEIITQQIEKSLIDSDEESDDLFSSKSKVKYPLPTPTPEVSALNLFASDNDDDNNDDDLFGSSIAAPKSELSVSKKRTNPTSKLFDDSDDDDIFKTNTKSSASTSSRPSRTKTVPISNVIKENKSNVTDDPLADLWK